MLRDVKNRRSFESLETRVMLAADVVTAVVNHTNLTVTGDGNDDAFLVAGDGTAGDVVITGFTGSDGNGTQINGTQDGTPVAGAPDGSITLTGVTGNITLRLGAGNVTVSVADLTASKNLSITGGGGDDTIDVGTVAAATTPATPAATNAVTIGGNLSIRVGGGTDTVTIGESPASGTDVTVSGSMSVAAGNGDDTITELSLAVSRDESIYAGSGDDSVTIGGSTVAAAGVTIGRGLNVSLGGGDDTIDEASTSVAGTESISVGSGDDTITLGTSALSLNAKSKLVAVHAAAISQLLADGDVSIGRDLDVQMGSGDSSLTATNVQIGDTLLVTGGRSFGRWRLWVRRRVWWRHRWWIGGSFGGAISGAVAERYRWHLRSRWALWFHGRRHDHARAA